MDELELAKKAVRRGLLSEDQLREARGFAEGGRSLVAVLLDLGYLKPQSLLELGETPPPPPPPPARSGALGWLLVAAAVGILGLVIGRACAPERLRYETRYVAQEVEVAPLSRPASTGSVLLVRAQELLDSSEVRLSKDPSLAPETEAAVDHAAVLLEEALRPAAALPRDARRQALTLLGRAQELAGRWEAAFKTFSLALQENPGIPEARLGVARVKLLLQDAPAAFAIADKVCQEGSAPAEAFLVRGKARLALGDGIKARQDLMTARNMNPSFARETNRLLDRLNEPR